MLTYEQIYTNDKLTIGKLKALVMEHCPHVKLKWNSDVQEFRVAYKGLKPAREEAMAAYVSCDAWNDKEGYQDVLGMAITMERDYVMHVFNDDKLEETLNKEFLEALRDPNSEGPQ